MKKKMLAILLSLATTAAAFTSFGSLGVFGAEETEAEVEETAAEEESQDLSTLLAGKKICLVMPYMNSTLHVEVVKCWEYLCDKYGAEFTYYDMNNDTDKAVDLTQTAINWGADLIGIQGRNGNEVKVCELCEKAGVKLVSYFCDAPDTIWDAVYDYDCWAGAVYENEVDAGYQMAKSLIDKGGTKFALVSVPMGNPTHDMRWEGIMNAIDEADGVETVSEARVDVPEFSNAAANACAMGDAIDSLIVTGAGLDFAGQIIVNSGRAGELLFSTTDLADNTIDMMNQEVITSLYGGHYIDAELAFILGSRAILGDPILNDEGKAPSVQANYMMFDNVDDVEIYNQYIFNEANSQYWYTAEEAADMITDTSFDYAAFLA